MKSGDQMNRLAVAALAGLLGACGGGSSHTNPPPPPPPVDANLAAASAVTSFAAGCNGSAQLGTDYVNAEVEPSVVVNPTNPANIVGAWQQDRWQNGGSQGITTGASFDGGHSWTRSNPMFSHCAGGNAANGGDFERASDPWVTASPNGMIYAMALTFTGAVLQPGSSSGMLVARSADGGMSWGPPTVLIADGEAFFNDKGSITADPTDSNFAYAVWDRLDTGNHGPSYFARSIDGGASWEAARAIVDPGAGNQTLGNVIVALPSGVLVNIFIEIDALAGGVLDLIRVTRSMDHGLTWSTSVTVADSQALGVIDPDTGRIVRDGFDLFSAATDAAGSIYVVWQDSRFAAGAHDGIALSRSVDGGLTWSTPVQVNAQPAVAAFTPTVHVRADGVIGVSYFDFRSNTASTATLPTDYWLATSTDGVAFTESHITGPFDLDLAPDADGLFLGDYQALASVGAEFRPFFVKTTTAGAANRTDVFMAFGPDH